MATPTIPAQRPVRTTLRTMLTTCLRQLHTSGVGNALAAIVTLDTYLPRGQPHHLPSPITAGAAMASRIIP